MSNDDTPQSEVSDDIFDEDTDTTAIKVPKEEKKKSRRWIWAALAALLVFLLLIALGCQAVFGGSGDEDLQLHETDLQEISKDGIVSTIALSANIEPKEQSALTSPVAGEVSRVHVSVGDKVPEGKVLVEMKAQDLKDQLADARAEAAKTRKAGEDQVQSARTNLANMSEGASTVYVDGVPMSVEEARADPEVNQEQLAAAIAGNSPEEIEQARQAVSDAQKQAKEANDAADKQVSKLQDQVDAASVKAPFAGLITEVKAKEGATTEGALVTIADDSEMRLKGDIKETEVDKVHEGDKVTFTTPVTGDKEYEGTVETVSPVAGSNAPAQGGASGPAQSSGGSSKVTFPVTIKVDKTDGLRLGSSARAKIRNVTAKGHAAVPTDAIMGDKILVYTKDGQVAERSVKPGETDGVSTAIDSDELKDSDRVIVTPERFMPLVGEQVDLLP